MKEGFQVDVMKDLSGYIKPNQYSLLYNTAEKQRDKLLLRLLWKTGRRVSELLLLKVSDIDFEGRNIQWNILKKRNPKKVIKPIDNFTAEILRIYIGNMGLREDDFVFDNGYGENKPICRQYVFQIVRRIGKKAGISVVGEKQIHPHHFRHGFAVATAKKLKTPADIRKLQQIMEHATLSITENYLQFGNQELRELIEEEEQ